MPSGLDRFPGGTGIVGLLFGGLIVPARRAARLEPAEALRST
jgi:ABC-type antimicrobial peptide transport system permease subunit